MRWLVPLLIALPALGLLISLAGGAPDDVRPPRTVDYVGFGHEQQRLDVYPAGGEGPAPAVIFVHGGGFRFGGREVARHIVGPFLEAGVTFVSVDYRLVPGVAFPDNTRDVAAAVNWVLDHADRLGIDPERVTLMGHSAGSHLVAQVAAERR